MTAPVRLFGIDRNELQRPQKSPLHVVSAQLTLLTTYANFVGWPAGTGTDIWLDVGNSPYVDLTIKWTHGATPTYIQVIAIGANWVNGEAGTADPTVGRVIPIIPAVAASGVTPVFEHVQKFTKTDYTDGSGFSTSTIKYVGGVVQLHGSRLVKFMALTDSVTNTPVATAYVGAATMA